MGIYSDYPGNLYKNGGICADGVYNDRGIYKEGGGEIIFLTYFDNFDENTGSDIPIVGDPYTLDITKQQLTKSSLALFGGTCPAVKDEYIMDDLVGFSKPIPQDVKFISSELFVLCEGTRYDFGSALNIGVSYITVDPDFSSTEFGIFGPNYSGSTFTMFNGTSRVHTTYFKFGKNIRFKISHIAVTYDVQNKIERFYVDGDIMLEIRNINVANYSFGFKQKNSGKSFTITGVACFSYDKSTNGGMNYPIPTERYV